MILASFFSPVLLHKNFISEVLKPLFNRYSLVTVNCLLGLEFTACFVNLSYFDSGLGSVWVTQSFSFFRIAFEVLFSYWVLSS